MKRHSFLLIALALSVLVYSCSKTKETALQQNNTGGNNTGGSTSGTCDTTNMSFANNIKAILQNNCYACHSNANFQISGVKLEDYNDLKQHADNGDLIGVITHASGYPPMPQGGPQLSDCNINKIKDWIDRGALNN